MPANLDPVQLTEAVNARLNAAIISRHYSPRTCEACLGWTRRFIAFHDMKAHDELDSRHMFLERV